MLIGSVPCNIILGRGADGGLPWHVKNSGLGRGSHVAHAREEQRVDLRVVQLQDEPRARRRVRHLRHGGPEDEVRPQGPRQLRAREPQQREAARLRARLRPAHGHGAHGGAARRRGARRPRRRRAPYRARRGLPGQGAAREAPAALDGPDPGEARAPRARGRGEPRARHGRPLRAGRGRRGNRPASRDVGAALQSSLARSHRFG